MAIKKKKKTNRIKEDIKRDGLMKQIEKQYPHHIFLGIDNDKQSKMSVKGQADQIFHLLGSVAVENDMIEAMIIEIADWIREQNVDPKVKEEPAIKIVGSTEDIEKHIRSGE